MSTSKDGIGANVQAEAKLVGVSTAEDMIGAPVATFTATHLRAKKGWESRVATEQARIRTLKMRGRQAEAQLAHELMCRDMMDVLNVDVARNTVVTVGKNDLLDKYFGGSGYTATWFCGLISSVSYTAIVVGDTMGSHGGWTEAGGTNAPAYTGNRPAMAFSAASAGSKATSSPASYTFTSPGTIKGMFGTTITTKDGATGILYNAVLFTGGDRAVVSTDVVNVSTTYTIT